VSTGRPSDYTAEITETICARLAAGESLRTICADEAMPAQSTVYLWLTKHSEFSEQYARAREVQAETLVDEILEISDDGRNDYMLRQGEGEETLAYRLNGEHVQRSRLRVDSRKWFASKVAPKKYGDKVLQEHSGPGGGPIKTEVTRVEMAIIDPLAKD
jgi:hypothetical protein